MKSNKKYLPLSKQAKVNTLQNLWAIFFWLISFVTLAVVLNTLLTQTFATTSIAMSINNNLQFMYTAWSIQATVSVLSFFISNIMTSIVKDIFYGLSIKDILTARVKWSEISFWHQSIMCIILVLANIPFVLMGWVGAVLTITVVNLFFIIYMLNNAFSYVFNAKIIANRVDKIANYEILTGKTILDLTQLLISLQNESLTRIRNSELRKAIYNVNFLLRLYEKLKANKKTNYLNQCLKVLNKILLELIKANNFDTLDHLLDNRIKNTLTKQEFSNLICHLIESVSTRFINYNTLDINEYKIHEHLVKWSMEKGSDNFVNSVSSSFYNYYNSVLLNSRITTPIKNKLLTQLFTTLTHPQEKNTTQQEAFKIALMQILKEIILSNNQADYKELLKTLNQINDENNNYSKEVMSLLNIYVYYLTFNSNLNKRLTKNTTELLHLQTSTMESNTQTLANMLKESNAHYINHFWSVVNTVENFDTTAKLSVSRNTPDFNGKLVAKFFLTYWKLFANGLENINLTQNEENKANYNITILNLITNTKEDEENNYSIFKDFCKVYKIDYAELKAKENWVKNADKIDEYIRDIYIDHLTNSALNLLSRLNITGTAKQEKQLLKAFNQVSKELPLRSNNITSQSTTTETLPFVIEINALAHNTLDEITLTKYASNFKQTLLNQIKQQLLDLKIKPIVYNKETNNLNKLLVKLEKLNINAVSHILSNDLDVLNNVKDTPFIEDLIKQEKSFKLLNELELNEYIFINSNNSTININPISVSLRQATKKEVEETLESYKKKTIKNTNDYLIGEYYGTKQQALNYYQSIYLIVDIQIKTTTYFDNKTILKLKIK